MKNNHRGRAHAILLVLLVLVVLGVLAFFVAVPPLAETDNPNVPTAPQTDIASSGGTSAPGMNLGLVLLFLGVVALTVAFVTPVPAALRRKDRTR